MTGEKQACAKCRQPTVTVHTLAIDGGRRTWLLCCLCMAELIGMLDRTDEPAVS